MKLDDFLSDLKEAQSSLEEGKAESALRTLDHLVTKVKDTIVVRDLRTLRKGWKPTVVEIQFHDPGGGHITLERDAYVHKDLPALAIHKALSPYSTTYTITHRPSGYRLTSCRTLTAACIVAHEFLADLDLDRPPEELKDDEDLIETLRSIHQGVNNATIPQLKEWVKKKKGGDPQ